MCGGSKIKQRANALAKWQKKNPRASSDFSDIRNPTLRARLQGSADWNRRSSTRSSRRSSGSSSTRTTRTSRRTTGTKSKAKSGGLRERLRGVISRAAKRVFNRRSSTGGSTSRNRSTSTKRRKTTNRSSSTIRIPSNRQAKAGARKARKQQAGTVSTSKTVRQGARSGFASQFRR